MAPMRSLSSVAVPLGRRLPSWPRTKRDGKRPQHEQMSAVIFEGAIRMKVFDSNHCQPSFATPSTQMIAHARRINQTRRHSPDRERMETSAEIFPAESRVSKFLLIWRGAISELLQFSHHVAYWRVRPVRFQTSGTLAFNSSSQTRALPSDGARQSPRGDSEPPDDIFGPFGSAERLNWLIAKNRNRKIPSQRLISSSE